MKNLHFLKWLIDRTKKSALKYPSNALDIFRKNTPLNFELQKPDLIISILSSSEIFFKVMKFARFWALFLLKVV